MTFRETKVTAIKHNIDTGKLLIADEIEMLWDNLYPKTPYNNDYEKLCEYAYMLYLETEYIPDEIYQGLWYLIANKGLTINQVVNLTKKEFTEMAIRYL